ncbi:hypothetical protein FV242_24545 [Methylobacterium sp. WL64]|uniref:hypothetical protein n=1 Tax=Methylobacterium sp. WL64 TaxID=2603894 RepID=UPI0011C9CCD2|nr:hypothetical protein [Methylobacterium sp. WL64]TXM99677.1 hypothetical protein FV242_24545 [Methylobacterium sp. WL64]
MKASTRRSALGAILAAPLTGGAVMALPSVAATARSDLAEACLWAMRHVDYINTAAIAEHWDDDRVSDEGDLSDAVIDRAIAEPSRSLSDLQAKAQLCLKDFEDHALPFRTDRDESNLDAGQRLVLAVLREVIKLCA